MTTALGLSEKEWGPLKFWQLFRLYDLHLIERWDHTSHVLAQLHNLCAITVNIHTKSKIKPKPPAAYHPYRKKQRQGLRVTSEDIGVLKTLGNALMGSK